MGTGRSGQMHGEPQLLQDPPHPQHRHQDPPWGHEGQDRCVRDPQLHQDPPMGTGRSG